MYVPMEKNPANSKMASRENTDYDTFGSIDSLIFEPKVQWVVYHIIIGSIFHNFTFFFIDSH